MKKWQDETDLIRMVTDAAMKQSSRRGFFAHRWQSRIGARLGCCRLRHRDRTYVSGSLQPYPSHRRVRLPWRRSWCL